jgi:xylulokinase
MKLPRLCAGGGLSSRRWVQAKRHRAYGSFGFARIRRALSSRVTLALVGVVSSGVSASRAEPDDDLQQTGLTHAYDPLLRSALKTGMTVV